MLQLHRVVKAGILRRWHLRKDLKMGREEENHDLSALASLEDKQLIGKQELHQEGIEKGDGATAELPGRHSKGSAWQGGHEEPEATAAPESCKQVQQASLTNVSCEKQRDVEHHRRGIGLRNWEPGREIAEQERTVMNRCVAETRRSAVAM